LKIGDEKAIVLEPPKLEGALPPVDPLGAARTMSVEFRAAIRGDLARLVQVDAPVGAPPFTLTHLNQNNRANWVLDTKFLVAHQGTTVRFRWHLRRNDKRLASSRVADVQIAPIPDQDRRFPTPRISGVTGVIEVKKLTEANELKVDHWPGQVSGQARYLRLEGTDKNGTKVSYQALNGQLTGTEQGSTTALILAWFHDLKDETNLNILFSVILGPGQKPLLFPVQTYKVESLVELQPVITSVLAPQGEVPQNTETISKALTIHCRGSANEQIEILVDGRVQRVVTTDSAGNAPGAPVTVSNYDVYNPIVARAKYGNNLSSSTRNVILRRPLQVDARQMNLHGISMVTGWPTNGRAFPGKQETRTVNFGVGARRFTSSNTAVATVDANCTVNGHRNGTCYVYVQDQYTTISFLVSVANCYEMSAAGTGLTFGEAVNWMNAVPGSISLASAWSAMEYVYGSSRSWNLGHSVNWMCDSGGCPAGYGAIYHHGGGNGAGIVCDPALHVHWNAWCGRPR